MISPTRPIPIHSFIHRSREGIAPNRDAPELCYLLVTADVILAQDWATGDEALIYGREFLKAVIEAGEPRAARFLTVGIDLVGTDDLELLIALVRTVRGREDYTEASWGFDRSCAPGGKRAGGSGDWRPGRRSVTHLACGSEHRE